jgi:hypothetical protein
MHGEQRRVQSGLAAFVGSFGLQFLPFADDYS